MKQAIQKLIIINILIFLNTLSLSAEMPYAYYVNKVIDLTNGQEVIAGASGKRNLMPERKYRLEINGEDLRDQALGAFAMYASLEIDTNFARFVPGSLLLSEELNFFQNGTITADGSRVRDAGGLNFRTDSVICTNNCSQFIFSIEIMTTSMNNVCHVDLSIINIKEAENQTLYKTLLYGTNDYDTPIIEDTTYLISLAANKKINVNNNNVTNLSDVKSFIRQLENGVYDNHPTPLIYDYNLDGNVNSLDVGALVIALGSLPGDINLDGSVDASDFNLWNSNKFSSNQTNWLTADLNGDGVTDSSDFNLWNSNKMTNGTCYSNTTISNRGINNTKKIKTKKLKIKTLKTSAKGKTNSYSKRF